MPTCMLMLAFVFVRPCCARCSSPPLCDFMNVHTQYLGHDLNVSADSAGDDLYTWNVELWRTAFKPDCQLAKVGGGGDRHTHTFQACATAQYRRRCCTCVASLHCPKHTMPHALALLSSRPSLLFTPSPLPLPPPPPPPYALNRTWRLCLASLRPPLSSCASPSCAACTPSTPLAWRWCAPT